MSRMIQCQRCGKERMQDNEDLAKCWCANCGQKDFMFVENSRKIRKGWKYC